MEMDGVDCHPFPLPRSQRMSGMIVRSGRPGVWAILVVLCTAPLVHGDGGVFRPRAYKGSLEERSQEAIILFHTSDREGGSFEDLILKIDVEGRTDQFAWVIPSQRSRR
jgi:hypothetical protein